MNNKQIALLGLAGTIVLAGAVFGHQYLKNSLKVGANNTTNTIVQNGTIAQVTSVDAKTKAQVEAVVSHVDYVMNQGTASTDFTKVEETLEKQGYVTPYLVTQQAPYNANWLKEVANGLTHTTVKDFRVTDIKADASDQLMIIVTTDETDIQTVKGKTTDYPNQQFAWQVVNSNGKWQVDSILPVQ